MSDTDDIVKEFLIESHENLDRLDRDLVALERDPTSRELLGSVFRTMHTIKGTCGFLGFAKLESVAHTGENLLSRVRDGQLQLDATITSTLLAIVDAVRQMLAFIESTGSDGDRDWSSLVDTVARLQAASVATSSDGEPQRHGPSGGAAPAHAPDDSGSPASNDPAPVPTTALETTTFVDAHPSLNGRSETCVRVDVGLLDQLMNLVSELVLARNQVLEFSLTQRDSSFLDTSQRLNLITSELQEGVMKTRMQPIRNVWAKFPRIVRDLAASCGKQVRLEMEGSETELDRTIIEAIKDPLTHIVRNSVDHGIEIAASRSERGKPAEGRILLRAFHEGGQVNIEISDDGNGIDSDRVKKTALARGLITEEQGARMTDDELVSLVFVPGFSTAMKISSLSGRGVGMDVVKTNIEKIGGTVDVVTHVGRGTSIKLKIPLTLAIIPALVVATRGSRFAIPQKSLRELVRVERRPGENPIERVHGVSVFRLRNDLIPLVHLDQVLGLESEGNGDGTSDAINIVVVQADDRQFGLVVDQISDTEEIVVKPLSKQLQSISVFAGATIRGDGRIALILDVVGIAQRVGILSEIRNWVVGNQVAVAVQSPEDKQRLLLFDVRGIGRMAIPLPLVTRIEEFRPGQVEIVGGEDVVQYRGQAMPLTRLNSILACGNSTPPPESASLHVIVCTERGRHVGVIIDRILDIVEETLVVDRPAGRDGTRATAVIRGKVTQLLDPSDVARLRGNAIADGVEVA
ncbi:MAG: chemotaxis protein CheA [Planctomycetes bacterium]|nr:chemotaxis protein CheA [Planctomycetota bacterium]